MRRLPGITFSAIILLLGSFFQLLLAVGMSFAGAAEHALIRSGASPGGTPVPAIPAWTPFLMYGFSAFLVALAVWGICTAIGLFRLRRWARYSVLVIGGCLALFAIPQIVIMLIMMAVPLPLPANVDPAQAQIAHTFAKVMFGVMSALYAVVCAVGVFWLVYFNRKRVREAFAGLQGEIVESSRPILISVVAIVSLIGGPSCLLLAFLPLPASFLGLTLHGLGKVVLYLVYGMLLTAAGTGLWRLQEWARRLSQGMQLIGLAHLFLYIARPSLVTKYSEEIDRTLNLAQPQIPAQFQNTINAATFGFSALLLVAIMVILHHYRGVFGRPPVAPAQIESTA